MHLSKNMALQMGILGFVVTLVMLSSPVGAERSYEEPPQYNYDTLPQTSFSCKGKLTGRYYADSETDCQMFHVCVKMSKRDIQDFRFLCPNGTVFDQEHQVCIDYYQVVCHSDVGTNPLGQIFEIMKLTSANKNDDLNFGKVPLVDPEFLGRNNIAEDFQAAEYNNNKLAARGNSLAFSSGKNTLSKQREIFYRASTEAPTTTTTTTTTTTERPLVFRGPISNQGSQRTQQFISGHSKNNVNHRQQQNSNSNNPIEDPLPQVYETTARPQIFHSTYRTTDINEDTTRPPVQSFQQQPSRFNDDFFRKLPSTPEAPVSKAAQFYVNTNSGEYSTPEVRQPTVNPFTQATTKDYSATYSEPTTTATPFFTKQSSRNNNYESPRSIFENQQPSKNNNYESPRSSSFENQQPSKSNNYESPRSSFESQQTSRNNNQNQQSSRNNNQNQQSSRNNNQNQQSSRNSNENQQSPRNNYESSRISSFENQQPSRTNNQNQQSSRNNYENQQSSRNNNDNRQSSRNNYENQQSARNNYESQQSARNNYEQNKQRTVYESQKTSRNDNENSQGLREEFQAEQSSRANYPQNQQIYRNEDQNSKKSYTPNEYTRAITTVISRTTFTTPATTELPTPAIVIRAKSIDHNSPSNLNNQKYTGSFQQPSRVFSDSPVTSRPETDRSTPPQFFQTGKPQPLFQKTHTTQKQDKSQIFFKTTVKPQYDRETPSESFQSGKYISSQTGKYYETTRTPFVSSQTGKYYETTTKTPFVSAQTGKYYEPTKAPSTSQTGKYYETTRTPYVSTQSGKYYETTKAPFVSSQTGKYYETTRTPYVSTQSGKYYETTRTPYVSTQSGKYYETTKAPFVSSQTGKNYETTRTPFANSQAATFYDPTKSSVYSEPESTSVTPDADYIVSTSVSADYSEPSSTTTTTPAPTTFATTIRPQQGRRGARRRINANRQRQNRPAQFDPQFKYSRRSESVRTKETKEKERYSENNEEIFSAEASVFPGRPKSNTYFQEEKKDVSNKEVVVNKKPANGDAYGRRLRPFRREQIEESQKQTNKETRGEVAEVEKKQDERPHHTSRVVKRLRQKTTTTTTTTEEIRRQEPTTQAPTTTTTTPKSSQFVFTHSTLRPVSRVNVKTKTVARKPGQPPLFTSATPDINRVSTTDEPLLITASDEEIIFKKQLKEKKFTTVGLNFDEQTPRLTTQKPFSFSKLNNTSITVKVSSKSQNHSQQDRPFSPAPFSVKKPIITKIVKKEKQTSGNPTKSPDYDYAYYNTDDDSEFISETSKDKSYGIKGERK